MSGKTIQLSKHRLFIPCKDCGARVALDVSKDSGSIKCECGWKADYEIQ